MDILGISCFYHDAAAVLVRDGVVIAAAEEERFSRKKHDDAFPAHAIEWCLRTGGISAPALDYVVFYEKPLLKFTRLLTTILKTYPRSARVFRESMITWLGEKLWMKDVIRRRLGVAPDRILFSEHHLSHAASAFLCSPFEEAAILTVDGVGEWATATMGVGKGNDLRLLREIRFPHSLGLLYSAFTAYLGFEVNEGEYKVMGMAPFGTPRYVDEVRKLIRVDGRGGFELDMSYFSFHHSSEATYNERFVRLFGPARDPRMHFFTADSGYPAYFGRRPDDFVAQADLNQRYADVAASIQRVVEEVVLDMARALHAETGLDRLCMAGGVALNSVANGRVLRETPFRELFIQPAAGDGGGAMGAALFAYHTLLGKPRHAVLEHAYLGEAHDAGRVRKFLDESGITYERFPDEERLVDFVVESLAAGKVVGWSQGRFEWGPRALGNRSILADPRRADMKDIVNTKIKFREPYRPFAPAVLVERAEEYFDLATPGRHYPARFMLLVAPVRDDKRAAIPAVTHVDGTARLQTVTTDTNPLFHRLVERFGKATGVPVLLNTSFNLRGEPIVNTPREAFNSFNRSDMDLLVVDRFVVGKAR
jgi:carbamoyltransferase